MEKLNLVELLKDCPSGIELDCTMYDSVTLLSVDDREDINFPIKVVRKDGYTMVLTKYGQYTKADFAKCVIFPKGKTTWEGFQRPFKDGDILFVKSAYSWILIYKESEYKEDLYKYAAIVDHPNRSCIYCDNNNPLCCKNDVSEIRFATEEEKEKLFQAIKDNGYKWNPQEKTLEKLIIPKFKVGDVIRDKDGYKVTITEVNVEDECYEYESMIAKGIGGIAFTEQNDWELVPVVQKFKEGDRVRNKNYKDYIYDIYDITDKGYRAKEIDADSPIIILFGSQEDNYELVPFDINTLVPFESKVLVRDCESDEWYPAIWGLKANDNDYPYIVVGGITYCQCIPYEGNQHLLGTTNDCDDFYRTWEQ